MQVARVYVTLARIEVTAHVGRIEVGLVTAVGGGDDADQADCYSDNDERDELPTEPAHGVPLVDESGEYPAVGESRLVPFTTMSPRLEYGWDIVDAEK